MADEAPIFKFDVCLYKNDSISTEDFTKYMRETYLPKASAVVKKHGLLQFAVTLTPEGYREPSRAFIKSQMKQGEWTVPDYDVVVSYWMYNPSDMGKVVADPDWLELEKDAPAVTDQRVGHLVLGHQTVAFTSDAMPKPELV
ncbi:hypothetical protein N0V93_008627 [Gnomoniopsis smithogilvyi]|uniref:EthD domain-containing protein n=1 Tax=Gnomoniopsis smithogilvyi TaxID=1191159 RepID=A0A9W9CUY7_9PEZI|nr:hypothetical protein N0V93_008627 [Gnomoniopsis smithogilvyi]